MNQLEFITILNETHQQFDLLDAQIKKLRCSLYASTLKSLLETSSRIRESISKELVECRRIGKITSKCQSLLASYSYSVTVLDEHVTFGILLNG